MSQNDHTTRRHVLEATAGGALFGLAGCLGVPVGASNDTPTENSHNHEEDDHQEETDHHEETEHHEEEEHDHSPTEHESGHDHDHEDTITPASDSATVGMTTTASGDHFEPHVTWVNPGGTVTFVNESGSHTATAYHPDHDKPLLMPEEGTPFDSGVLTEAGAEFDNTFDTPGVYHFYCAPHETVGMLGSVIVGEPDAHGQPALGEVPTSLPETARKKIEHLNEKVNEALGHEH